MKYLVTQGDVMQYVVEAEHIGDIYFKYPTSIDSIIKIQSDVLALTLDEKEQLAQCLIILVHSTPNANMYPEAKERHEKAKLFLTKILEP